MKTRKSVSFFILFLFLIGALFLVSCTSEKNNEINGEKAIIFKSSSCGCCGIFSRYMDDKGFNVEINDLPDLNGIKEKYAIPIELQSCHTTIVGDYFVEGHIPAEAIQKLLLEKPDIAGIALPGMPSGSPGMPGPKQEKWMIYAVGHDGQVTDFMEI
ncbi:MAG: DUF411 domain-containing protein [archaeon]|nr:DUF411 domain-containing protein [archaeon]